MMRLPLLDPNDQKSINYELATQMVDKYILQQMQKMNCLKVL